LALKKQPPFFLRKEDYLVRYEKNISTSKEIFKGFGPGVITGAADDDLQESLRILKPGPNSAMDNYGQR